MRWSRQVCVILQLLQDGNKEEMTSGKGGHR